MLNLPLISIRSFLEFTRVDASIPTHRRRLTRC